MGAVAIGSTIAGCAGSDDSTDRVVTASSSEGSPMNANIEAIADVISSNTELDVSPQLATGWEQNIIDAAQGNVEFGITYSHYITQAQNDEGFWREGGDIGPLENEVRMITPVVHRAYWYFAAHPDSNYETVYDLDGERISFFTRGEAMTDQPMAVLDAAEIDYETEYMNIADAGSAFRDGNVDASVFLSSAGRYLPSPTTEAVTSTDGFTAIDIPEELHEPAQEINEYINFDEINADEISEGAGVETHFDVATSTFGTSSIVGSAALDEDLVYEYVSTVLDNQDELTDYNPVVARFGVGEDRNGFADTFDGTQIHDGALRYYDEENIDYPEQPN